MKRAFAANLILLLGINLLVKPLYIFGIDRSVQNTVGPEQYGLYFALLNFTYLFQILNDFGLQNFNNRHVSRHPQLLPKYFPTLFSAKLMLSTLFLLVLIAGGWLAGNLQVQPAWLLGIALNQILLSLLLFVRSNLSGLGRYRTDSLLSSLDKVLMILLIGAWLIWSPGTFTIMHFILAQGICYLLSLGVAVALLMPHLSGLRFRLRMPLIWWAVRSSFPYAVVVFLMYLYTYVDAVMIERMLPDGAREAGIYASGYRLLDAVCIVGYLFAGLLLPMFSRLLGHGEPVQPLVEMSGRALWSVAVVVSVTTFWFGEELSDLLYRHADARWGQVLSWLMLSFLPWSITYIYGTLLTASGNLWPMNRLFLVCIALNVGANLYVIPRYGAPGAALTTLLTQSVAAVGQYLLALRYFPRLRNPQLLLQFVGLLALVFVTTWIIFTFAPLIWLLRWILAMATGVGLVFLLRMISVREWWKLLREREVE